jgi:two-component system, cell cycle sensor histidine kinase and response regulator CckA
VGVKFKRQSTKGGVRRNAAGARKRVAGGKIRLDTLLAQLPSIIYVAEPGVNGRWHYVSPQIEKFLGFSAESWLKDPEKWFQSIHPEDRDRVMAVEMRTTEGHPFSAEYRMRARDGRIVWVRDEAVFISGDSVRKPLLQGVMLDITAQKRVESVLVEWKNRYEMAVEVSGRIVYDWDLKTNVMKLGGGLKAVLGYSEEEIAGEHQKWLALIHPEDLAQCQAETQRVLESREPFHFEYRVRRKDGVYITIKDDGYFIQAKDGVLHGMLGFLVDVTEQRKLEEQLRQSQKMDAIGQLAGGIAHDFNNLLGIILGHNELLVDELREDGERRRRAEQVKEAALRAAALTNQLLTFSRKQVLEPEVFDLNHLLMDTEKMLRRLIGEHIDIEAVPSLSPATIRADPNQWQQVILNLALNARDAMPDGGKLAIKIERADLALETSGIPPGHYCVVAVTDNGTGMDSLTQARIFEPFFTTKPQGKGTGLGLSTVYGIVKQSGGHIAVDSRPGRGTTMRVYAPWIDAPAKPAPKPLLGSPEGTETVLIVEDQPAVREVARECLQRKGYRVLDTSSASEAIEICSQAEPKIDLVLSDVVMPGMGGRELAEKLRRLRPAIKVLYMSGYPDDALVRHDVLEKESAFIQKPFSPATLARKVRHVLDGR